MVKLVLTHCDQMDILEWELLNRNIKYEITTEDRFGFPTPYLIVYGVPLDYEHSLRWIKEQNNE